MKTLPEIMADLLDYPILDWRSRCDVFKQLLSAESQTRVNSFDLFSSETEALSLSDLQELYTRTFDLNPVCALDIGYHLFGENYKRGVFLANLRETEAAYELGQEHQLPDYLPVLLRLVSKLEDEELRAALIEDCMIPAVENMITPLKDGDNPYRYLLETVHAWLHSELGDESKGGSAAFQSAKALPCRQAAEDYFAAPPLLVQIAHVRTKSESPKLREKVIVGGNV